MSDLITVRVTTSFPDWPLHRQTPGGTGVWGRYRFVIDRPVDEYDFWVFYEAPLEVEHGSCAPENVVFFSGEPLIYRDYPDSYLDQFATLVLAHRYVKHRDARFTQAGLPWHLGANYRTATPALTYDDLRSYDPPKTLDLSIISSSLHHTEGHQKRLDFARRLKAHMGERIDLFGRGVNDFTDKAEATAPYKYHIVIENSRVPDYWSEKIADAILANCFPFYSGCPNLGEYLPAGSYREIDIDDFEGSLEIIEATMSAGTFEASQAVRQQARELILDRYNFFAVLAGILDEKDAATPKRDLKVRPLEQFAPPMKRLRRAVGAMIPDGIRSKLP
jgi:hypothetical protein